MRAKLIPVLISASLSACALAPGMDMGDTTGESTTDVPMLDSGEPITTRAIITPITADLIVQKLTAARRQAQAAKPPVPAPQDPGPYRLGAHDVLSITVWDHPELTIPAGEFRTAETAGNVIGDDGTIFYPYVGVIRVEGMTIEQLRDTLTRRLAHYIENPQLDVRVVSFRSKKVYVVGEVKQPGIQAITDVPMTVVEAINRSGGVNQTTSDMARVTVSRGGEVIKINLLALYEDGDLSQNILLKNGDVLNVPDNNLNKVFVIGEVLKPSSQFIDKGRMTLAEALGDAGGVDPLSANAGQIYVIRSGQGKPEIFHLNASSPDAMLLAHDFRLAARDVVYVDPAQVTRWNRVITQILPTASTLNATSNSQFPPTPRMSGFR
jgi:polysaccharide export outer membrane protein